MEVLVDSSVWIDYFRSGKRTTRVDQLLDENLVVTNDLVLAELVPYLMLKNQTRVIALLREIRRLPMAIDWDAVIGMQVQCLRKGNNGIGIPDLLIAQNAKANGCAIYTLDKHFNLLASVVNISLY